MTKDEFLRDVSRVLGGMCSNEDTKDVSRSEVIALATGASFALGIPAAMDESVPKGCSPSRFAAELVAELIRDFPRHRDELLAKCVTDAEECFFAEYTGNRTSVREETMRSCPFSGKTMSVASGPHEGQLIEVEDWAYKTLGSLHWECMTQNAAVLIYLIEHDFETSADGYPYYRTAICGKIDGLSHIVRLEELELDE